MVSVCLPSDALLQHLPSYLGFFYLGGWVSLHGCSSKAQPLLLTLDDGYLLTTTVPDLQRGIAPLGPPVPAQPLLLRLLFSATSLDLRRGWLLPAAIPSLGLGVPPQGHRPWPQARGSFSQWPLTLDMGWVLPAATGLGGWVLLLATTDLGRRVAPPGRSCAVAAWHSGLLSLTSDVG